MDVDTWLDRMPVALPLPTRVTPAAAGCWLDGAHGWTNSYRVVDLAVRRGWPITDADRRDLDTFRADGNVGRGDVVDNVHDMVIEVTNWLTDCVAPEGYMFEWVDGDFMLNPVSDD